MNEEWDLIFLKGVNVVKSKKTGDANISSVDTKGRAISFCIPNLCARNEDPVARISSVTEVREGIF